jgi:hypothetical protein
MENQEIKQLFEDLLEENSKINYNKDILDGEQGIAYENVIYLSDCILDKFGLPHSNSYSKFIENTKNKNEIDKCIEILEKEATKYLNSQPLYDQRILKEAIELKLDADDVLAEIKVISHIYTVFVYDQILLKRKDLVENILKEFDILKNNNELLNDLGVISDSMEFSIKNKSHENIKKFNLLYFEQYLKFNKINLEKTA